MASNEERISKLVENVLYVGAPMNGDGWGRCSAVAAGGDGVESARRRRRGAKRGERMLLVG